jgi:hypothetical protein
MADDGKGTLIGIFKTHEDAEKGVNALVQAGFPPAEIGFMGPGEAEQPQFPKAAAAGTGGGAVAGAIAGGLLGVASMAVAPGVGPVVTVGAWLPPLIGVVTGGSAGGTLGGLLSLAGIEDEGLHYRQQIQSGRYLVNVTTDDAGRARAALQEAGALEVADLGDTKSAKKVTEPTDKPEAE